MLRKPVLLVAGLSLAASVSAQTIVDVPFGGAAVALVIPKGYCVIPREDALGALHYKLQEDGNKGQNAVAVLFADCSEWSRRKANPALLLSHHGNYLFQLTAGQEKLLPAAATRADLIKVYVDYEMKSAGPDENQNIAKHLREKMAKSSVPSPKLQGNVNLGLIDRDDVAAYMGVGGSFVYESRPVRFVGVVAATTVRGAPVTINLYGPAGNKSPFQHLLTQQKDLVRKFVAANE